MIGDIDNGKIPNFADGINLYGNEGENEGGNFVPLILELPEPLDIANARIRLTYSASDPAGVKKTGQGTVDYPDVYVPAPGHLRIWTAPGTASRKVAEVNADGHFVASGVIYNATNFDLRADRTIRLYVEGIDGSAELADQPITVEIDPNGEDEEPGFLCEDRVRVTVIKLDITQIKYPNDGMSFTTRDEPPDHVENEITLTANIEPDYYDTAYNGQIDWTVENNRWYNETYNSGTPTDPPNGYETTLEIAMPPIPGAANGRNWHKLSYRVKANVTIANTEIEAMAQYITQDEIDMLRQQYIDMNKDKLPERGKFKNNDPL